MRPGRLLSSASLLAGVVLAAAPAAALEGGDPQRGARVFQICHACHALEAGAKNLQGPTLDHLWGRRAGERLDFDYSDALVEAGQRRDLRWNDETLDAFLTDPQRYVPGLAMGFFGLKDPGERADLIAFLRQATR